MNYYRQTYTWLQLLELYDFRSGNIRFKKIVLFTWTVLSTNRMNFVNKQLIWPYQEDSFRYCQMNCSINHFLSKWQNNYFIERTANKKPLSDTLNGVRKKQTAYVAQKNPALLWGYPNLLTCECRKAHITWFGRNSFESTLKPSKRFNWICNEIAFKNGEYIQIQFVSYWMIEFLAKADNYFLTLFK